jgi:hypothetical protein
LFACLGDIAPVGEEHVAALADSQDPGASGKATQITDVRKVGNQEEIKLVLLESLLQSSQAALVVHPKECSSNGG